jgi:group I intron endonuclease
VRDVVVSKLPRGCPLRTTMDPDTDSESECEYYRLARERVQAQEGSKSSGAQRTLGQVVGSVLRAKRQCKKGVRTHGVIYKVTSPSGKAYVGQTINFRQRMNRHKLSMNGRSGCKVISAAISKYGWEAMRTEILLEDVPVEDLDKMEQLMIAEHGTYHADTPGGYNLTRGGDKNPVSDPLIAAKMQIMYKSDEWKEKQLSGYTKSVREKVSSSQRTRQQRGGFKQLTEAGRIGLPLANERKNTPAAKAKRKATWAAKREAKLSNMDPKKAALVRRQAELDAERLAKKGHPPGYKEYQDAHRAKKRAERDSNRLTPGNCEHETHATNGSAN